MSAAELIEQLLVTSRDRLAAELHTPSQAAALGYARTLWALEDAIRQLADHLHEGDQP